MTTQAGSIGRDRPAGGGPPRAPAHGPVASVVRAMARGVVIGASRLGARLGWEALQYNYGIYLRFHRLAQVNAPKFADAVLGVFPGLTSVADIGCGTGVYVAEFKRRGLRAVGCEYAATGRRWARSQGVEVYPFDVSLEQPALPGSPFDVAFSLEVAEHIPAPLAGRFVDYVARTSGTVVFTAAHPGQGGTGHVNEQPKGYWIALFERAGYRHDGQTADRLAGMLEAAGGSDFFYLNMMVFRATDRG